MSGIDQSELMSLAADFGKASASAVSKIEPVVERGAVNIKNTMVEEATSSGSYRHFSRSISYDRSNSVGTIAFEIGPDKSRTQGALGNILYFGTSNNGAVLDVEVGLRVERGPFEKNIADLGEDLASGRG